MVPIYLPLKGEGHQEPKSPLRRGWASRDYPGVDPNKHAWVGLRCDDIIVIDCDSDTAAERWRKIAPAATYTVKTPRGWHYYYEAAGAEVSPDADIFRDGGGIDVRAGTGSYVVAPPTPGYAVHRKGRMAAFKPAWVPERAATVESADEWDVIPEGRRNDTLAAMAGSFRRQGMSVETIYKLLLGMNKGLCDPPLERAEIEQIARSAARYEPEPDWAIEVDGAPAELPQASDLLMWMTEMHLPPPPQWHWKPYLPKSRLVLLDGSEGIGKGLMCVQLALQLAQRNETVLWMSAEDDPEEDIQRRLLAAGYNAKRHGRIGFFTADPKFPPHIELLEDIIRDEQAQLVVMDPGRSFLAPPDGTKGFSYNDESHIRPGLEALNKLAKRSGCTILFVHHWNKNTGTTVQYRSGGSGAFAQVVRHRITVAWHGPTDGGTGAFEVSKSNIGPKGAVHSYSIEPKAELDTAVFVLGQPLDHADLGAWMQARSAEDGAVECDRDDEIIDDVLALPGGRFISPADIVRDWSISSKQAASLLGRLTNDGELRKTAKGFTRVGEHER